MTHLCLHHFTIRCESVCVRVCVRVCVLVFLKALSDLEATTTARTSAVHSPFSFNSQKFDMLICRKCENLGSCVASASHLLGCKASWFERALMHRN